MRERLNALAEAAKLMEEAIGSGEVDDWDDDTRVKAAAAVDKAIRALDALESEKGS
jgi:hypothetical protein